MKSFIFGEGQAARTPQELAQMRAYAAALMRNSGTPRNVGEGISALGDGLSAMITNISAGNAEKAGNASADADWNALVPEFPAAPEATAGSPVPSPVSAEPGPGTAPAVNISGGREEFVNALLPAAIEESKRTGIDPRIIVAQAAQETGWGRSAPGNNYFGIKSHGKGGGQTFTTHEYIDGKRVKMNDSFRRYESPGDSVRGYGDFILTNPRYKPFREAQGLDAQLAALQASGYATDPNYSRSVGAIARGIQLPNASPKTGQEAIEVALLGNRPPPQSGQASAAVVNALMQGGQQEPSPSDAIVNALRPGAPAPAMPPARSVGDSPASPRQRVENALLPEMAGNSAYSGPTMQQIMRAAGNPFLNDGRRGVVEALFRQKLAEQDPMTAMQREKAQIELERLKNPTPKPPEPFTLSGGQTRFDGAGNPIASGGPSAQPMTPEQRAQWGIPGDDQRPYMMTPEGPKLIGGSSVTVNNNMGGEKFSEEFAKGDASALSEVSQTGQAAQRNLGRIDRLEKILAATPQGAVGNFKAIAGDWGINTEGLDNIQSARALINSLVPEQRPAGSGPMSDADLELFKQSLPRIINQPGGNQTIINTMRAIGQYDAEGASIVQQLRRNEIDRATAFERLQSRQNPLAGLDDIEGGPTEKAPEGWEDDWEFLTPEERKKVLGNG